MVRAVVRNDPFAMVTRNGSLVEIPIRHVAAWIVHDLHVGLERSEVNDLLVREVTAGVVDDAVELKSFAPPVEEWRRAWSNGAKAQIEKPGIQNVIRRRSKTVVRYIGKKMGSERHAGVIIEQCGEVFEDLDVWVQVGNPVPTFAKKRTK